MKQIDFKECLLVLIADGYILFTINFSSFLPLEEEQGCTCSEMLRPVLRLVLGFFLTEGSPSMEFKNASAPRDWFYNCDTKRKHLLAGFFSSLTESFLVLGTVFIVHKKKSKFFNFVYISALFRIIRFFCWVCAHFLQIFQEWIFSF